MQTLTILQSFDREDESIRVLKCAGFFNFETYDYASSIINRLFQGGISKIVFDLTETEYISSSGWAVFVGGINSAKALGGDVKLACMRPEIRFVFDALELDNLLESYDTVKQAVEKFKTSQ